MVGCVELSLCVVVVKFVSWVVDLNVCSVCIDGNGLGFDISFFNGFIRVGCLFV